MVFLSKLTQKIYRVIDEFRIEFFEKILFDFQDENLKPKIVDLLIEMLTPLVFI